ncbi:MAG: hypothetical protein ABSF55_02190 [Candidatus Staskawiczbacteria bacterium]|jgi:hypothetical protein
MKGLMVVFAALVFFFGILPLQSDAGCPQHYGNSHYRVIILYPPYYGLEPYWYTLQQHASSYVVPHYSAPRTYYHSPSRSNYVPQKKIYPQEDYREELNKGFCSPDIYSY